VDVEKIKCPFETEIAGKYFSKDEIRSLDQRPPSQKAPVFFHLWTLKEAYIKAEGNTFKIPLDAFWFDISNPDRPTFRFLDNFKYETNCVFRSYNHIPDYVVSVCAFQASGQNTTVPDPIKIELSEIVRQTAFSPRA
jgi:4'-phosphopantetheinyl transferase